MSERISIENLQIAAELADFIETRALPGTGVSADTFWSGFARMVAKLTPENRALLERREELQEVIDDWLFVYHPGGFESGSPAVYQRLLRIADTVGAKTLDQTERYRDERVADALAVNLVAPAGQRLRRGLPLPAIIGLVAVALVWILGIVPDLLGSLFSLRP